VLNGGVLVVADTGNATLRRLGVDPEVDPVATFSGTHGNPGHSDGPGLEATLRRPRGAALGASGALYVADAGNHTIRRISVDGTVSTLAGTAGKAGFVDGAGPGQTLFNGPTAVAAGVASDGSDFVIVADTGNHAVRKVLEDGTVTTLAGTGAAGSADSPAQFNRPAGVALDAAGDMLVADTGNQTLRRIAAGSHAVTTLAGTAGVSGSQDGAAGPGVSFNAPAGLAVAKDGSLYVADSGNGTIRRLANGQVSTFAGKAGHPGSADGTGTQAQLDGPVAIALDARGNLFVANSGSSTVCVITPRALVSTIIGGAGASLNDPGPLPARISPPYGIAVDPSNANIYITIDDAVMLVDFTK
jgi:sugar lactone lactonase YvrE